MKNYDKTKIFLSACYSQILFYRKDLLRPKNCVRYIKVSAIPPVRVIRIIVIIIVKMQYESGRKNYAIASSILVKWVGIENVENVDYFPKNE